MTRRPPSGKPRRRQIEAAPEKMDWTRFAQKARSEACEHVMCSKQHTPEAVGVITVVGGVRAVLIEGDAIRDLARHLADADVESEIGQCAEQLIEELRDRLPREHDLTEVPVARSHPQHVIDEVEVDLERAPAVRNWRRGQ